jgi:hypothetical protein
VGDTNRSRSAHSPVALAQSLRGLPSVQAFIKDYPGIAQSAPSVDTGFPWWLQLQHFLNMLFMMFIIRAGIQILADHPRLYWTRDCTPGTEWFRFQHPVPEDRLWTSKDDSVTVPGWLGIPGVRHSIGLARWWHFPIVMLWTLNGVAFYVLIFATGQWLRLVPVTLGRVPCRALDDEHRDEVRKLLHFPGTSASKWSIRTVGRDVTELMTEAFASYGGF